MLYAWDINVPAGTLDNAPISQKLQLSAGIITSIEIKFPAGCHGLVKVRIMRQNSQLAPSSTDEYITGDDETVQIPLNKDLGLTDFSIIFQGSAPTSIYAHIISIRINLTEPIPTVTATGNSIEDMLYRICVALNVQDGLLPIKGFGEYPVTPPTTTTTPVLPAPPNPFDPYADVTDIHQLLSVDINHMTKEQFYYVIVRAMKLNPKPQDLLCNEIGILRNCAYNVVMYKYFTDYQLKDFINPLVSYYNSHCGGGMVGIT